MRICLIDGDPAPHVWGYINRDHSDEGRVISDLDYWVSGILNGVGTDKYVGFLQGTPSHRHLMFKDYKGNRPPKKPWVVKWEPLIRTYLIEEWKFQVVDGMEVDDAIASAHYQLTEGVICSGDKDFRQLPGLHYIPKTGELFNVERTEADEFLLCQILSGDSTDNIKGLPGIGIAKAPKLLKKSPKYLEALRAYVSHHGDVGKGLLDFSENAIKIILKKDNGFKFEIQTR